MNRLSREDMLMKVAQLVAERSTCQRKKVGAVIARGGRIISMGYAGTPSGTPHCLDQGCVLGPDGGCISTIHAEQNAIAWAAKLGISTDQSELYVTCSPCLMCAKLIINSGIQSVFYHESYRDTSGIELLMRAGLKTLKK